MVSSKFAASFSILSLAGFLFAYTYARLSDGMDIKDFTPEQAPHFMMALQQTFRVAAILSLVAVMVSWLRGKEKR